MAKYRNWSNLLLVAGMLFLVTGIVMDSSNSVRMSFGLLFLAIIAGQQDIRNRLDK